MSDVTALPDRYEPVAIRINRVHEYAPWGRTKTYELVRSGHLPAKRLGRSTFVLRTELEAFISGLEDVVPGE